MALKVVVRRRERVLRTQIVSDSVVRVGTHANAGIRVEDDSKATQLHAVIELNDRGATLIDLGSDAGTVVNGKRVNRCKLQVGDEILIGTTSLLVEALG
jgi:pSer/pThr/pTyr-binding forkhead associated (FHA) protein